MGIGLANPDASSVLHLEATDKGFIAPRMTTGQRLAIVSPANGLLVYDINFNCFFYYAVGSGWTSLCQLSGPAGATGPQGTPGVTGLNGATGTAGIIGPTGLSGTNGLPGLPGSTGPSGIDGLNGTTGPTGLQGITGAQGSAGNTGAQGIQGITGAGIQGATGTQGVAGATGAVGLTGSTGLNGNTGATGATGNQGNTGATGSVGATGIQGATGLQGVTGFQGIAGVTGAQGATGIQGVTGAQGVIGVQGITGVTGVGATGATGAIGVTGPTGFGDCNTALSYSTGTNLLSSTDPCGTLTTTIPTVLVHSITGSTDISMNGGGYVSTGLNLTFTPVKSNLLVSFTISGRSDPTGTNVHQNVFARLMVNGVSVGGSVSAGQDLNSTTGVVTAWNISFTKPIVVTAGVPQTLVLQWFRSGNMARTIFCEAATASDIAHRTISAIEF